MLSTIITLALLGQTPSGIGEPPRNATPELAAMYSQMNADLGVHAETPASPVASPVRQRAVLNAIVRNREIPPVASPVVVERKQADQGSGIADLVAKQHARRAAENVARAANSQAAAEAEAEYKARLKAEAEYKAALPYLLEDQRQRLERMSAMERNAALHRMAAASEQIAGAITLDFVARQNARLGYSTPVLNTYGPGVTPYGPYGAVMYPTAGPAPMPAPYANMGFPN